MSLTPDHLAIWLIAAFATAGMLLRPFGLPEAVWAVAGALQLLCGPLAPTDVLAAVGKGLDVYLFLVGMMLLSEVARREGLFDWIAGHAVNRAAGSPQRLFLLVYAIGVIVTTLLSNDATAVVLTPAVAAAARTARVRPLPYLFVCAFVANAASFVLPISNPANLVLYGEHVPPLGAWLASFALPSAASVVATYLALRAVQGRRLEACACNVAVHALSPGGRTALAGIGLAALALLVVSALDMPLGGPTCLLGTATALVVLVRDRAAPWGLLKGVSWSVLPLVAGLFVLVQGLDRTGLASALAGLLRSAVHLSWPAAAAAAGTALALLCNAINNLPAGLIASTVVSQARPPQEVVDALLIGVDLGPNLSINGSLATILWLTALRREGEQVGFGQFLKAGVVVMPPALLLAIGARILAGA